VWQLAAAREPYGASAWRNGWAHGLESLEPVPPVCDWHRAHSEPCEFVPAHTLGLLLPDTGRLSARAPTPAAVGAVDPLSDCRHAGVFFADLF